MTALPPIHGDEPGATLVAPELYQVVYCSCAAPGVAEADVTRIVARARRHNPAHAITGMLVFGSGVFFQWLEGPRPAVQALMARLHADPRHHDVVTLSESEEVRERLFPDWDMELVGADHIRDVLADALDNATDERSAAVLTQLLAQLDAGRPADWAERIAPH
jgi:hypothetical protein